MSKGGETIHSEHRFPNQYVETRYPDSIETNPQHIVLYI